MIPAAAESRPWRFVLFLLGAAAMVFFVARVWSVLIPFLLGIVLAYLVSPLVGRFVAAGWRRDRVVLVLYAALLTAAALLAAWLLPRLHREIHFALNELPAYAAAFDGLIERLNEVGRGLLTHFIGDKAADFRLPLRAEGVIEHVVSRLPANVVAYAHLGLWVFIVPFVSFFALSEGREWIDRLFDATPSAYVESLLGLFAEANAALGGYIRGALLESACVAALTTAGLAALGFDGAILVGLVTGLLNPVPFLAPLVGGSLALLVGYFQGLPAAALLGIVLLFAVVRLIDDFAIIPFVIGHHVRLHPVVMLFAILAGYQVAGILGLVFAVPTAAILKVALSVMLARRRDQPLLGQTQILS